MFEKPKRWNSKKYRDAARDQECTLRLPCCNGDPATTVLAHAGGAGMGTKSDDFNAVDACSNCHATLDGAWPYPLIFKAEEFSRARFETISNRIKRGVLK